MSQGDVEAVKRAAEQGDAEAQFNLGWMYRNDQGVPQSDAEAVKWHRCAAEQGHVLAQYSLGWCAMEEVGMVRDYVEAHKWYSLAILGFSSDDDRLGKARRLRDKIAEKMTREEVKTAQRLAIEWQPKTWEQLKSK